MRMKATKKENAAAMISWTLDAMRAEYKSADEFKVFGFPLIESFCQQQQVNIPDTAYLYCQCEW